jgi:F-type H+-transporting ATPase subunit delta
MTAKQRTKRSSRQLFRLCVVDGAVDDRRVLDVARHLAASKSRGALAILSDFHRLVRLHHDQHTAVVESAEPLASNLREQIQADLSRTYGTKLDASFQENPALIGGMRIKVGSDVYDGSVRARLAALAGRL